MFLKMVRFARRGPTQFSLLQNIGRQARHDLEDNSDGA